MSSAPKNILIVDDDAYVCEIIQDALVARGFTCRTAGDGLEALRLLETEPFSVMVADVVMPGMNGLELAARAGKVAPDCRTVLITGVSRREYLTQAIALGVYDYLEKPFRIGEMVEVVTAAEAEDGNLAKLPLRAAEALERDNLTRQAPLHVVLALACAVEAKDPYTRRHSEQVAFYSLHFAKALNVPATGLELLRTAAMLHDVGMIGVPDGILRRSGPLTDAEFAQVRRHPAVGADIVSRIGSLAREADLIRHHHENWDGSGYPDGLAGEQIPRGARVLRAADAVDAMLMRRCYKDAYPVDRMLDELTRCAGTQFDPQVAHAAAQWCRMNPDKLILPDRPAAVA